MKHEIPTCTSLPFFVLKLLASIDFLEKLLGSVGNNGGKDLRPL